MIVFGRLLSFLLLVVAMQSLAQETTENQATAQQMSDEERHQIWALEMWQSMSPQTGEILLAGDVATLNVPDSFYYLNKDDSRKVLEEVWGNPPGAADALLGMLFPAGMTPFESQTWGVTIEYEQDGYVSDVDAGDIDYAELLEQMQADTQLASAERVEQGYDAIVLIGWAEPPYYEAQTNKLYWAKEIKFGSAEHNTLNYNIRVLGRKGVLVLNFIAGISQLTEISRSKDTVLAMADFNQGSRYADFDPDLDDVAAYGIGALVAGKVIAKTGLIAAGIIFLKKFGLIALIAAAAFIRKFFKRSKKNTVD
ncbi:MAG: DUF2167 domain-containing protein [Paraglaciecola sp.]|nr:DUF2167 domain-containing protein [Paraglaciecola sp.]